MVDGTDHILQALVVEYSKPGYDEVGQKFIKLAQAGEWEKLGEELDAARSLANQNECWDVGDIHYGFSCYAYGRAGINESGLKMAEASLKGSGLLQTV